MPSPRPAEGSNLAGYHAYAVDGVVTNASGVPTHLRLRNPWAVDGYSGTTDGANDGYVTITAQQASRIAARVRVGGGLIRKESSTFGRHGASGFRPGLHFCGAPRASRRS